MDTEMTMDKLTMKTRRLEYQDGLFDFLLAAVFLVLGGLQYLVFSESFLSWFIRIRLTHPELLLIGSIGAAALLIVLLYGSRRAIDALRKKGMAVMENRGERATKQGRVVGQISDDGRIAVLALLCSETDFTSKSDDFQTASQQLAESLLSAEQLPASVEELAELATADGKKMGEVINEMMSKTGEKVTIGGFARFDLDKPGLLKSYVHFNRKVGTIVQIDTPSDEAAQHPAVQDLANDLTMHITAANPMAVTREDLDPEMVAHEKEIAAAQIEGKPANIVDKIVTGKINKWFKQVVLLEQPFVKDDSKTVQQLLDEVGQKASGPVIVRQFRRLQIG